MKNPVFAVTKDFDINVASSRGSMQRQHYHDTYELYLVLEGNKTLLLDDKKYLLKKGSMFIVEPFILHMTASAEDSGCKRYIIELSPTALSPLLSEAEISELFNGISTCVLSLDSEELQFVHTLFKDAHRYKNMKGQLYGKLMVMALSYLIDFIRRRQKDSGIMVFASTSKRSEEPIMQALRYINLHYSEHITLDLICGHAHMSRSNFCLAFKKAVGDTFVNYINTLRISQAHRLLTTTDLPLTEIASKTGFTSVDYLTRVFKKIHGTAPAKIRRKTKKKAPADDTS